jgi:hypothetical protein
MAKSLFECLFFTSSPRLPTGSSLSHARIYPERIRFEGVSLVSMHSSGFEGSTTGWTIRSLRSVGVSFTAVGFGVGCGCSAVAVGCGCSTTGVGWRTSPAGVG